MLKIGILMREDKNITNKDVYIIYKSLVDWLKNCLIIPLCPQNSLEALKPLIASLDGVILGGGSDYDSNDLAITEYLYQQNIPTLGICLGMQMMATLWNGDMEDVADHHTNRMYAHDVFIKENSKLSAILKNSCIKVNSRHHSAIVKTTLDISAVSEDNVVEAIEARNKNFFIGVQWHPEDLADINSKRLLEAFLKECYKYANR